MGLGMFNKNIAKVGGDTTDTRFIFEVTVDASGSITLPLVSLKNYDFIVDWGDGDSDEITAYNDLDKVHTYVDADSYDVTITGTCESFKVSNSALIDTFITEIKQWGDVGLTEMNLYGCSNMTITATDILDTSGFTTFSDLFRNCSKITSVPNISSWDVSNVTSMANMFSSCVLFNQNISWVDSSSLESMAQMFYQCYVFDGTLDIDTSNVRTLASTFYRCYVFNQDITSWDIGKVESLNNTFYRAYLFNQDIGSWNTSSVTNMYRTFCVTTAFDQDLGGWDVEACTAFGGFLLNVGLSTANYDALLIGWNAQTLSPNEAFDGGTSKYTSGGSAETARTNMINSDGWTISDGGTA